MLTLPSVRPLLTGALVVFAAGFPGGCLSAKYRPAQKSTPPPVMLAIAAADGSVGVTVDSVIVFHGPGSWKRNAYWDEYVVTIVNRGAAAVSVRDATLVGLGEHPVGPRTDPWKLEKESREAMKEGFWLPKGSGPDVGAGLTVTGLGMAAGAVWGASTAGAYFGSTASAALCAGFIGLAIAPVVGSATIYRNVSNRHDIEHEFDRRRFHLPREVQANQAVHGSLFFPITPGPRTLTIRLTVGAESRDVPLDLGRIGKLHLMVPDGDKPVRGK
jgi:hypothetical protein